MMDVCVGKVKHERRYAMDSFLESLGRIWPLTFGIGTVRPEIRSGRLGVETHATPY